MHLITGYSGFAHITAANDGDVNSHVFGTGKYVFDSRDQFRADLISNNIININSGEGLLNGRYFEIATGTHDVAAIENGSAGTNRIDLIVARYTKDGSSAVESMNIIVLKGEPGASPVAPVYENGNILDGVGIADFPLYKVTIEGLTVKKVEALFTVRKDIVNDVIDNNAATVTAIAEDNAATKTAIQTSNAETLASIKADNQETVEAVSTNNAETLAAVQASNAETLASVDTKLATTLTATTIWESDSTLNPHHGVDISHPSINNYKYVEVVYTHQDTGEIPPDTVRYYSTGLIPVINNNTIYANLSVAYSPARDDGVIVFKNKTRALRIVGKKTYTSEADTVQLSIARTPGGIASLDRSIITDENGICINKIVAFK